MNQPDTTAAGKSSAVEDRVAPSDAAVGRGSDKMTGLAVPGQDVQPLSRDIIKEIAMDIGRAVVAYVEVQYPNAITATSSTFKLSLRNTVYNEIMAALETVDEDAIRERLAERKKFRRRWKAAYRNIRDQPITEDVIHDV